MDNFLTKDVFFLPSKSVLSYEVTYAFARLNVTITANPECVDEWLDNVKNKAVVINKSLCLGLDTEWCLHDRKRRRLAIVQLCFEDTVLIYQLSHAKVLSTSFVKMLESNEVEFTGVEVNEDLRKLRDDYGVQFKGRTIDTRDLAARTCCDDRYLKSGLKTLTEQFMGTHLSKDINVTLSNWEKHMLSFEQIKYAAIDAYVSYKCKEAILASHLSIPID
ncbi:putative protein P25 [Pistachio ampelovirus A]|uniref:3'-5' exonuclease domain-containing protein n=1 Tax=Pistachio ampelovirus A TaxID=2093224 RepID=A0A499PR10_9CLOS|nr:putative protein P25 [Pistachio ampelovirus A]AVN99308.1 putative protein P25 [Pistachio ampelovirus A]